MSVHSHSRQAPAIPPTPYAPSPAGARTIFCRSSAADPLLVAGRFTRFPVRIKRFTFGYCTHFYRRSTKTVMTANRSLAVWTFAQFIMNAIGGAEPTMRQSMHGKQLCGQYPAPCGWHQTTSSIRFLRNMVKRPVAKAFRFRLNGRFESYAAFSGPCVCRTPGVRPPPSHGSEERRDGS